MVKHLKGVDTLRAVSALAVVWGHIELLKKRAGIENMLDNNCHFPNGHIAVIFFFVISGFLITYLLVKEKESKGKIDLKKFYLRRIYRIWPLYYLILLLSFIIFPVYYSKLTILLCLTIFPNIAHVFGIAWPTSPQVWSIGVEEQFYLFWPIILTFLPKRKIAFYLLIFIIVYTLIPFFIECVYDKYYQKQNIYFFKQFFYETKFNCMAIGSLVGFLYAEKNKVLNYIKVKIVAFLSIVLLAGLWFYRFKLNNFNDEFYSVLFVIVLYNIIENPKINIDTSITCFLGKISYGIYMYHWIVVLLALKYIPHHKNQLFYNLNLYFSVFSVTIFMSWLSFISYENYFLKIKKKYEVIT